MHGPLTFRVAYNKGLHVRLFRDVLLWRICFLCTDVF